MVVGFFFSIPKKIEGGGEGGHISEFSWGRGGGVCWSKKESPGLRCPEVGSSDIVHVLHTRLKQSYLPQLYSLTGKCIGIPEP